MFCKTTANLNKSKFALILHLVRCGEKVMNYGIERGVAGGATGVVGAITLFLTEENPEILRVTSCRGIPLRPPDLSCYTLVCVT